VEDELMSENAIYSFLNNKRREAVNQFKNKLVGFLNP
jgi:hypothetical protein